MVSNWKYRIYSCVYIYRVLYGLFHITSHINLRRPYQPENFSLRAWYWSTVHMGCDMKKSISYCVYHIFQECTEVWYKFSGVWYKLQECDMSHDDKDKNKQRYDTSFRGVVRAVKSWQVIQAMHFTSDLASAHHFRRWRLIFESDEYFPYPIRHLNFQKIVKKFL